VRAFGSNRVNRGGSWNNNAQNCRAANRNRNTPDNRNNNLGFRVAAAPREGMDFPARWNRRAPCPGRKARRTLTRAAGRW
jgi:hypothetical protein